MDTLTREYSFEQNPFRHNIYMYSGLFFYTYKGSDNIRKGELMYFDKKWQIKLAGNRKLNVWGENKYYLMYGEKTNTTIIHAQCNSTYIQCDIVKINALLWFTETTLVSIALI